MSPREEKMETRKLDAWGALRSNALAHEAWQIRNRTFKVKSKTQDEYLPLIPSEIREEYVLEFYEHSGRYMDSGYSLEEADRLTLDDLGCCEFWAFLRYPEYERQEVSYRRGREPVLTT